MTMGIVAEMPYK